MSADPVKRFAALVKKLRAEFGDLAAPVPGAAGAGATFDAEAAAEELVFSFLLWESTTPLAKAARQRLRTELVDFNELRVCLASELAELVGPRDPRGDERAQRLRATLAEIYRREHAITLAPLVTAGKREAKLYLESLEGIPPFVVARTLVMALGGHAVAVDERLRDLLAGEGIVEPGATVEAVTGWLERQVRSAEAGAIGMLLQAWSDSQPFKRSPKPHVRAEPSAGAECDRGEGRDKVQDENTSQSRAPGKLADRPGALSARKGKAKKSGAKSPN